MMVLARGYGTDADEVEDVYFEPLTAEQARVWRANNPVLSPWSVVGLQCLAGVLVVLCAWMFWGATAAWSAGYGVMVVVVSSALFARGLMGQFSSLNAATASFGFFLWEAVKIAVMVLMIVLAPRLVVDLNWLALLVGLFVTLKMVWLALLLRPKTKTNLRA